MKYAWLLLCSLFSFFAAAQSIPTSGKALLDKSIAYHDPDGRLLKGEVVMTLNEPRPNGDDRFTTLTLRPATDFFSINRKTGADKIMLQSAAGVFSYTLNGSSEATAAEIDQFKLTQKRMELLRNYYHYLWFLPGKLLDPGTILHDEILIQDFFGKKGYQLKVTYDPEVGKDIWYFYFDLQTYALIGYRFYHDESANDGEYILIEGELENGGVRIPATRKWYKHQQDEYLGQDILTKLQINN